MSRRFLNILAVALVAAGLMTLPVFAQAQSGTLDKGEEMLPPNAKPGECYARIFVPPVFKTETDTLLKRDASTKVEIVPAKYEWGTEEVLVKEADEKIEIVPAKYKWVEEKILVKPESKKIVAVPATYETVTEKVIDTPARVEWKKGEGPYQRIDNATGEIMCLVEVPATYKTVTKKVLKSPATTKEVVIPAEYKTVKKRVIAEPPTTRKVTIPAEYSTVRVQKLVSPPTTRTVEIPAEYQTVTKKVKVSGGGMEWTQVLCKTNATPATVQSLQRSLKSKGFYAGPIDGIIGQGTLAAVRDYQARNGLVQGGLTIETLKSLGLR